MLSSLKMLHIVTCKKVIFSDTMKTYLYSKFLLINLLNLLRTLNNYVG